MDCGKICFRQRKLPETKDLVKFKQRFPVMNNTTAFRPPTSGHRVDTTVQVLVASIMCVEFLLAAVSNLLVIVVILTKIPLDKKPIHSLILSLATADFLQAFCQQLPGFIEKFQHSWTMGGFVCKMYSTGRSVFAPAGLLVIALIGVERFRSLERTDGIAFSVKVTRILIVVVWLVCLAQALPMTVWFDVVSYGGGFTRCAFMTSVSVSNAAYTFYTIATRILFFLVPLALTWFCYMGVVYRMVKSSRKVTNMQNRGAADFKRQQTLLRVTRTCVLIAVVFTVCWMPFNLILLYGSFTNDIIMLMNLQYAWLPAAFASCVNPLIYGLMIKAYRDALLEFFRCSRPTVHEEPIQTIQDTKTTKVTST